MSAGQPAKLAELIEVGLPFAASAHWRTGAYLRPVVEAVDEHENYGVVLTSTTRARLFIAHMGEITEHEDLRMLRRYTHLKAEDLARKLG